MTSYFGDEVEDVVAHGIVGYGFCLRYWGLHSWYRDYLVSREIEGSIGAVVGAKRKLGVPSFRLRSPVVHE